MKRFSQVGKTISVFSLGMFCGIAYLISCGQTNTAVSSGGAINATAITAETIVTTGTITAPSVKLTTGAGDGKFLTSNSSGDASWGTPFRTSCPTGYTLIGTAGTPDAFCISTSYELPNAPSAEGNNPKWRDAQSNCAGKTPSASLCTINEWRKACKSSGVTEKDSMIWLLDVACFQTNEGFNCDGAWVSSENPGDCEPMEIFNRSSYQTGYRCCFR